MSNNQENEVDWHATFRPAKAYLPYRYCCYKRITNDLSVEMGGKGSGEPGV